MPDVLSQKINGMKRYYTTVYHTDGTKRIVHILSHYTHIIFHILLQYHELDGLGQLAVVHVVVGADHIGVLGAEAQGHCGKSDGQKGLHGVRSVI